MNQPSVTGPTFPLQGQDVAVAVYDPSQHDAVHSLIEEFASVARHVHAKGDFDESLGRITATAQRALGGCEAASISMITKNGPATFAATDTIALDGDQIQYDEGEGPCLDAALRETWVSSPDLASDPRWPRSAARLSEQLGVGSMFSCRMALDAPSQKTLGGLNLYATRPRAFSTKDQMLALLLSSLGAVVIDAARHQEELREAIDSRQVIGEAVGMLRVKANLTSQDAFDALSRASQRTNVKLRDLAEQMTADSRVGRNSRDLTKTLESGAPQATSSQAKMEQLTPTNYGDEPPAEDREDALDGRERDAEARDRVADRRDAIAAQREGMLDHRDDAVKALLVLAEHRDSLAEQRDIEAEERDQAADQRPFSSPVEYAAAVLDRELSSTDRFESGVDRDLSAGDRAELLALPLGQRRPPDDERA